MQIMSGHRCELEEVSEMPQKTAYRTPTEHTENQNGDKRTKLQVQNYQQAYLVVGRVFRCFTPSSKVPGSNPECLQSTVWAG